MILNIKWVYNDITLGFSTQDVLEELQNYIEENKELKIADIEENNPDISCIQILKNAKYLETDQILIVDLINQIELI